MIRAPNALAMPTAGQPQQVYYDVNGVWQWDPYAVGGATRPDSFSGMNPQFNTALEQMFAAAPPEIRDQLRVTSGYRSPERQAQLWEEALAKYGSEEAARQWVAPPGRSQHNHGNAADLRYLDPSAREWAHANAGNFGLSFPLANEDWHIELAGARGNAAPHGNQYQPGSAGGVPASSGGYGAQGTGQPNALAIAELDRQNAARRQQALNALTESLRRPIYTNEMRGSSR